MGLDSCHSIGLGCLCDLCCQLAKIFSTDVNIGYFASYSAAKSQVDSGKLTGLLLTNAQATMRNTMIQGILSVIFLLCVAILLAICAVKVVKILQTNKVGDKFSSEEAFEESNLLKLQVSGQVILNIRF